MKKITMRSLKWVLCCLAIVFYFDTRGQTYLGISSNLGNQLSFMPASEGLKRPLSISGNLLVTKQEKLIDDWVIQYSGALGVLGYELKVISIDTLHATSGKTTYWDYFTVYGHFDLLFGKEISVKNKKFIIKIGGGVTYYKCLSSVQYGIGIIDDNNNNRDVFFAEIDCAPNNLAGFAKISTQLELNNLFTVGLEYSHHFSPALNGFYEFYHTTTPSYGTISLYQKEISLVLLVKISKVK